MKKNQQVNLLGISGKAGSGKDTIGRIIQDLTTPKGQEYLGNGLYSRGIRLSPWQIKKFAGKVKQIVSILTGIPVEDFEKEEVKNSYLCEEWDSWQVTNLDDTKEFFKTELEGKDYMKMYGAYHIQVDQGLRFVQITVRQALQWVGTDLFRDRFHPNSWVNALFTDYQSTGGKLIGGKDKYRLGEYPNWIITDVRFKNEAQAILDRKGILIRVNRTYKANIRDVDLSAFKVGEKLGLSSEIPGALVVIPEHSSETALDLFKDFNYTLNNDGNIEDLIEKVKEILTKEKLLC